MINSRALETFSEEKQPLEKKTQSSHKWLILAIASAVCYGIFSFFQFVVLQKSKGLNTVALTINVALVEAIVGIIIYFIFKNKHYSKYQKDSFTNYNKDIDKLTHKEYMPYTLGTAVLNALGIITLLLGYVGAPNPGFSDAVSDAYVMPLAILSYYIYKVKMNELQLLGCIMAVIGTTILST